MPQHLSPLEVSFLDRVVRFKAKPQAAWKDLQLKRRKARKKGPSRSAVYTLWSGKTYERNKPERRGRKVRAPPGILRIANQERLRLLKEAKNEYLVVWNDVYEATRKALKARGLLTRGCKLPECGLVESQAEEDGGTFPTRETQD